MKNPFDEIDEPDVMPNPGFMCQQYIETHNHLKKYWPKDLCISQCEKCINLIIEYHTKNSILKTSIMTDRENVILIAREYAEKQGTNYPVTPNYIAMIKAQLREAFYSGFESRDKEIESLKAQFEVLKQSWILLEKENSTLKDQLQKSEEMRERDQRAYADHVSLLSNVNDNLIAKLSPKE